MSPFFAPSHVTPRRRSSPAAWNSRSAPADVEIGTSLSTIRVAVEGDMNGVGDAVTVALGAGVTLGATLGTGVAVADRDGLLADGVAHDATITHASAKTSRRIASIIQASELARIRQTSLTTTPDVRP